MDTTKGEQTLFTTDYVVHEGNNEYIRKHGRQLTRSSCNLEMLAHLASCHGVFTKNESAWNHWK